MVFKLVFFCSIVLKNAYLKTQSYDILFADLQTLTYNIILSDTRCHACKLYYYTVGCVSVRGCMCSVVLKKHIYKSTHITFYCTDLQTLTNSILLQIYKPSHISNIVFANTICCACKYYNCNMCECERMVCIVLFFKKIQIMCSVVLKKYIYKLRKVCIRSYIS